MIKHVDSNELRTWGVIAYVQAPDADTAVTSVIAYARQHEKSYILSAFPCENIGNSLAGASEGAETVKTFHINQS